MTFGTTVVVGSSEKRANSQMYEIKPHDIERLTSHLTVNTRLILHKLISYNTVWEIFLF
jgi:hypothetical protein